jgi:hypothetical protein
MGSNYGNRTGFSFNNIGYNFVLNKCIVFIPVHNNSGRRQEDFIQFDPNLTLTLKIKDLINFATIGNNFVIFNEFDLYLDNKTNKLKTTPYVESFKCDLDLFLH